MKRAILAFFIIIILTTGIFSVDFDLEVNFVSTYVWRGFTLYDSNVFAIQPSLTYHFGKSGLSLNLFTSYALKDRDIYKQDEEIDFSLIYDFKPLENLYLSLGITNYGYYYINNYSFKNGNSQEVFISASLPYVIFNPTLSLYYDFNLGNGLYIKLSGDHTIELNNVLSLDISFSLGYNSGQWVNSHGLSDANIVLGFPFNNKNLSIIPYVAYTHVFLEPVSPDNLDKFWGGFSISLN